MKLFNKSDIDFASDMAKSRIDSIAKRFYEFTFDPKKKDRINNSFCISCFYSSSISGQASTNWKCNLCLKEFVNANTDVPKLCFHCAQAWELCQHCGADIYLRVRRKIGYQNETPNP